jgi:hypothetical protein
LLSLDCRFDKISSPGDAMGAEKRTEASGTSTRRPRKRALLAAGAFAVAVTSGPVAADGDDLGSFLSAFRCPVALRLASIHARGDREREDERFLILALAQGDTSYVQCAFFDEDRRMMCEAASGYYDAPEGAPRHVYLPAKSVAALASLGFSTDDSHGNFQRVMETADPSDFVSVAEVLLSALYETYGARLDSKIEVHSALVDDLGPVLKASDCPPTS